MFVAENHSFNLNKRFPAPKMGFVALVKNAL